MEQLKQEISELEAQEAQIERDLNVAETIEDERQITNDLNLVRNRLSEKREELRIAQEKHEAIETKVHAGSIPFAVAGIDFTDLPPEVITLIDQVVRADRRRLLNEHAIELEQLETANKSIADAYEELKEEHDQIYRAHSEFVKAHDSVIAELRLQVQDAQSKRDAAVREKEEADHQLNFANEEIRRLNDVIADYQRAKIYGERESQQIIEITPEENSSINEALAAVKKLYAKVEDWGSVQKVIKQDGTFELVKRDEVEKEWEMIVPDMPGGSESTESFRDEAEPTGDQLRDPDSTKVSGDIQQEGLTFQTVPDTILPSVEAPAIRSGAAEEDTGTVSLEERVAELEKAVFGQVKGAA